MICSSLVIHPGHRADDRKVTANVRPDVIHAWSERDEDNLSVRVTEGHQEFAIFGRISDVLALLDELRAAAAKALAADTGEAVA